MDEHKVIANVGGLEEGYLFEFCSDGVFLTAYPGQEKNLAFDMLDIRSVLTEFLVDDYDVMLLAQTLKECTGEAVLLGHKFTLPKEFDGRLPNNVVDEDIQEHIEYGKVLVDITPDKLSAVVRFDVESRQSVPTVDMVYQALREKNIKFGIMDEAVKEAVELARTTVVAKGEQPQNGQDAVIQRNFNVGEKGVPVVDEHDRADYKNLNLFLRATKGQVLAERIPHTKGIPGTNVFGDKINAKNGKPKPLPNGKNTIVKDENLVVADMDGQIVDKGNKIDVDPRLVIKGDVGMATGNLDFDGAIDITGSVEAGFIVKATGDIEIGGMISGADVEGRNISVKGGVRGMHRGRIRASENFKASFAENADIEAGGDVYIDDIVMHSNVRAGHHLIMDTGKGRITGGNLAAGEEIRAKCVGNEANVVTRLSVGVNPMLQREQQLILKDYHETKKRLEMLNKTLATIDKLDMSKLAPARVEQINAIVRSQFPLLGKVERCEKRMKEIDAELQQMKNGKIRVSDVMYPGVRLSINSIIKNVQVKESNCTQYVKDDFIVVGAY